MIVVVGDFIDDEDVWLEIVRQSPEGAWPVTHEVLREQRDGGAGAVAAMVEGLDETVIRLGDVKPRCRKTRIFVDGDQVLRLDNDDITPIEDVLSIEIVEAIPANSIVLIADYGKGVVQQRLLDELVRRQSCGELRLVVDPSRHRSLTWYHGVWAILPNRVEAGVDGVSSAEALCRTLSPGPSFAHICVKLDREGMVADKHHIPADCNDPVDVCGAGDMVLAAIGVALSRGARWVDACRFANEMAGLKCRQRGATPVSLKTVSEFSVRASATGPTVNYVDLTQSHG